MKLTTNSAVSLLVLGGYSSAKIMRGTSQKCGVSLLGTNSRFTFGSLYSEWDIQPLCFGRTDSVLSSRSFEQRALGQLHLQPRHILRWQSGASRIRSAKQKCDAFYIAALFTRNLCRRTGCARKWSWSRRPRSTFLSRCSAGSGS